MSKYNAVACKKWREKNKEHLELTAKAWRDKNPDKLREYQLSDKARHPERGKQYYAKNRETLRTYQNEWTRTHKEQVRRSQKKYTDSNKEVVAVKVKARTAQMRAVVVARYSDGINKCVVCDEDTKEFLCIDHIDDNGAEHRKTVRISNLCRWLIKNNFPVGFQVLCANCNIKKELIRRRKIANPKYEYSRQNNLQIKKEATLVYSNGTGSCVCCNESDIDVLSIDHIGGGGVQHRKKSKITSSMSVWLKKNNYPSGYQTLCYNCNTGKEICGECPHKRKRKSR